MKGLFLREYYVLKRPMTLIMILLFVVITVFMAFQMVDPADNNLADCRLFGGMYSLISAVAIMSFIADDEKTRWLNYVVCSPVSRKTYVTEKYLIALPIIFAIALLSSIISLILMLKQDGFIWNEYLLSFAVSFTVNSFLTAVLYPLSFRFGSQKGTIVFLLMFIIAFALVITLFIVTGVLNQRINLFDYLASVDPGQMSLYLLLISGILIGISWPLSFVAIRRRQF